MNSKEFVIWLKGIIAASNSYNITPKQFDELKDTLSKVNDNELPNVNYFPYTKIQGINYTETRSDKI
jgi:hypothetical protein